MPNTYFKQDFSPIITDRKGKKFGKAVFSITICYTSSTREAITNWKNVQPILIENETQTTTNSNKNKKQKTTTKIRERSPLITEIPDTGRRSIFYFDKADLKEENLQLEKEIQYLTARVQNLKEIISQYEEEPVKKSKPKSRDIDQNKTRTEYFYHTIKYQKGGK